MFASSAPTRLLGLLLLPCLATLTTTACRVPEAVIDTSKPITQRLLEGIKKGRGSFKLEEFDQLLKTHVKEKGRVDYQGLKKDRAQLKAYLRRLAEADLANLSRDQLLALLINAYNAYTLDLIIENYPVSSIKKLKKPWDTPFCEVGGDKITLNDLENKLLRPQETFGDPRIHFAINCASIGCPLLRAEAYTGERIDAQLEDSTRRSFTDSRYLKIEGDRVKVSKILDWFKDDFITKSGSRAKFIQPYAPAEARKILEARGDSALSFLGYDWNLNDIGK